jgi:hypothetical protein
MKQEKNTSSSFPSNFPQRGLSLLINITKAMKEWGPTKIEKNQP